MEKVINQQRKKNASSIAKEARGMEFAARNAA
jgi:hypothetical protein